MIYGFVRSDNESSIYILINNDMISQTVRLPIQKTSVIELLTNTKYSVKNGILEIQLEPMSGMAFK